MCYDNLRNEWGSRGWLSFFLSTNDQISSGLHLPVPSLYEQGMHIATAALLGCRFLQKGVCIMRIFLRPCTPRAFSPVCSGQIFTQNKGRIHILPSFWDYFGSEPSQELCIHEFSFHHKNSSSPFTSRRLSCAMTSNSGRRKPCRKVTTIRIFIRGKDGCI